ncbi:hypothetical protein [Kocuria sabuli]|uniref:hypothetical protein n=1 Tax=Kocuria sabuli TaxID=3071448 RepID=UPI0034D61F3D
MDHHAAVLVQVDPLSASVRLVVSGCLTEDNQQAVRPFIVRARTLIPPATVTVDLTGADHVEATAVDLLRWTLDEDAMLEGSGPVELLLPDPLPGHRPAQPDRLLAPYGGRRGPGTTPGLAA